MAKIGEKSLLYCEISLSVRTHSYIRLFCYINAGFYAIAGGHCIMKITQHWYINITQQDIGFKDNKALSTLEDLDVEVAEVD